MKRDLHLPRDLAPTEERLRAALRVIATTTPIGGDDAPSMVVAATHPAPTGPRRWAVSVAAAVATIAVGTAGVIGGVPKPSTVVGVLQDDQGPSPVPPGSVDYLLPEAPPEGFREAFVGRSGAPVRASTSMQVYATGGDPFADRVLVFLRASEPSVLNTILSFDGGIRDTIAGRPVTFASAGALQGFDLSPSRTGAAVIGRGLEDAVLRAAAAGVLVDGQAASVVPSGFTLVYEGRSPLIEAPADDVVFNNYATPDGLGELELRTVTGAAAPLAALVWQLNGRRETISVRGAEGVMVTIVDPDTGSSYRQLLWSEGNLLVSVGGRGVVDETLSSFARSLRPASRGAVDLLIARSEATYSED